MQQFDFFTQKNCSNSTPDGSDPSSGVSDRAAKGRRRQMLGDVSEFFDGQLDYIPQFLSGELATKLFSTLERRLAWKQEQIQIYGKWHTSPRLQAWYGDKESAYQYSGVMREPQQWNKSLLQLKDACERTCQTSFNSVLANLYRDGEDSMGFHSDDEKELGVAPVIASLTLGGTRNFDLVHKTKPYKLRLPLPSGSLLVMKGTTQQYWQHGIARTKQFVAPRINLTFRNIVQIDSP